MDYKAFKRYIVILGLCLGMVPFTLHSQELDATVTVNTQQLETSFRDRFETLKTDLQEFINGTQWTSAQFSAIEKIKCTFAFTISEVTDVDRYKAVLTIQSRRPVFNSNYQTTTFNWLDEHVSFEYTEGQTLTFNEYNLDNELIATVAYYAYVLLGIDFDSFSKLGGDAYFRKAENIVNQMQAAENNGWRAFADIKNRHAIITAFLDDSQKTYRELWYDYHRLGLDQMALSVDKGRVQISEACESLAKVREAHGTTPLLSLFISSKLDELINVYSKAPKKEKDEVYKTLSELYPTYTTQLTEIKQTSN